MITRILAKLRFFVINLTQKIIAIVIKITSNQGKGELLIYIVYANICSENYCARYTVYIVYANIYSKNYCNNDEIQIFILLQVNVLI